MVRSATPTAGVRDRSGKMMIFRRPRARFQQIRVDLDRGLGFINEVDMPKIEKNS
jgi:hypothetical protein